MKKFFLLSLISFYFCSYNFAQGTFFTANCVSSAAPKYSSAINNQTTASGYNSFASGYLTTAPGDADLRFSKLFDISGVVFGWDGVSYKYGGPGYWE